MNAVRLVRTVSGSGVLESLGVLSLIILSSVPESSTSYSFYKYKEEKRFLIKFKFIQTRKYLSFDRIPQIMATFKRRKENKR